MLTDWLKDTLTAHSQIYTLCWSVGWAYLWVVSIPVVVSPTTERGIQILAKNFEVYYVDLKPCCQNN